MVWPSQYGKPQTPPLSPNECSKPLSEHLMALHGNDLVDPSGRRNRTSFTVDQVARLEKEFAKENYVSRQVRVQLAAQLKLPESTIKVWFQNRRMKDKRQKIAAAWPYAAVYSDPTFAASILTAAANSVSMPYAYSRSPMIPPVLPPPAHAGYSGYRYSPYHMPSRIAYPSLLGGMPGYPPLTIPKPHTPPHDMHLPSSPHSSASLSPSGSDNVRFFPRSPSPSVVPE